MAKCADKYFKTDAWKIIEEGFDPEYAEVAESVFSLANGYMGIRGSFEEGYSGKTLAGNYFNGIYERKEQPGAHYKGISNVTEYMVNAVDWLYVQIKADGEMLDLANVSITDFYRELDLKNGVLTRSFLWTTKTGKQILCHMERFLSMKQNSIGAQKIEFQARKGDTDIELLVGLDFSKLHQMTGENLWSCSNQCTTPDFLGILGKTKTTGQQVYSSCLLSGDAVFVKEDITKKDEKAQKKVCIRLSLSLKEKERGKLVRITENLVNKNQKGKRADEDFTKKIKTAKERLTNLSYEKLKEENETWWKKVWERSDICITGDEENQQGIRFCIFQMYQTYHGGVEGNIGAKGLTGEAYNGNAFWDTETYCLPFYVFNDLAAARELLKFRYDTLFEAKQRAKELDCEGAFYPIATISGKECCNLWQHASLQLQASTGVAYGIWFYEKLVDDVDFLYEYGLEMLIEICRMLATRGSFTENGMKYGYYCVMGPDEFQMMVNHNCYTNYMAKFTFSYTLENIENLRKIDEKRLKDVFARTALQKEELQRFAKMEQCMYLPYDEETKLFEQHEGFYQLPHVDVAAIPIEEFPLYNHWSYDRIYRNDMIKQPDVLMLFLLFNSSFTKEQLQKNYEFYEPRCIHESSLSPSVHSILASQLKKHEEAYDFFGFATRMDLDNYNRNTQEGLHTTSIAAAWMNIVYGFGGLRSDGEFLSLSPSLPKGWEGYSFRLGYREDTVLVEVTKQKVCISTLAGTPFRLKVYDSEMEMRKERIEIPMPERGVE